jgi:hypothetical protein
MFSSNTHASVTGCYRKHIPTSKNTTAGAALLMWRENGKTWATDIYIRTRQSFLFLKKRAYRSNESVLDVTESEAFVHM